MTNEVIAEGTDIIETPTVNNKVIQWKVTLVGPFVVGRCSEVLPGYTSIVEDVTDKNLPPVPEGIGDEFVYNPSIGFVVQGAFEITGPSLAEPVVQTAGELLTMWRYKDEQMLTAIAPFNSYVCLTPRDPYDGVIWNRSTLQISPGISTTFTPPNSEEMYLFVAKGEIFDQYGNEMTTNGLYAVESGKEYVFTSYMNSYLILLSK